MAALHPECTSYADVYDKYGLLNSKTIMAHAIYLTEEEKKLLAEKKGFLLPYYHSHSPQSALPIVHSLTSPSTAGSCTSETSFKLESK